MLPPDAHHSLFSILGRAREMRRKPTRTEAMLWEAVRRDALSVHVRRQHVLHPFIVDFYVATRRLVIEVDGSVHDTQRELDAARDAFLADVYNVRVLRVRAGDVERDLVKVLRAIRAVL